MKNCLFLLALFASLISRSQNVQVDGSTYSPQQLIEDILVDSHHHPSNHNTMNDDSDPTTEEQQQQGGLTDELITWMSLQFLPNEAYDL